MGRFQKLKSKNLTLFQLVLASIVFAMLVLLGLVGYSNSMTQRLVENSFGTLEEVTQQQAFNFNTHIESDVNDLKAIAYFTNFLALSSDESQLVMDNLALFSNFEYIGSYALDGMGMNSENELINLNNYVELDSVRQGNTVVGTPVVLSEKDGQVLPIVTPIYNDVAEISGFLLGTYSLEELERLILPSFDGNSYFYIVDCQGSIILSTSNENILLDRNNTGNLLEFMQKDVSIVSYDDFSLISEKIANNESGYFSWEYGEESRYTCYMPTGVNDWYIFSFVPQEDLLSASEEIMQSTLFFAFISFVVFLSLASLILYLRRRDYQRQRRHAKELEKLAYYDELTGLPNYALFKKKAKEILQRNPNESFSLLKFDIEQFKMVNEILGTEMGDRVLCAIAQVSNQLMQQHAPKLVVARVGSDDFLVLGRTEFIKNGESRFSMMEDQVHELCGLRFRYQMHFRYGRYEISEDEKNIGNMLENVNLAHSLAKKTGRMIINYGEELKSHLVHENEMENRMQQALEDGEFLVYLQPKFNLKLRVVQGAEALVRWKTKDAKLISPGDFIPLFEKNGFVTTLDYYMFEQCCRLLRDWRARSLAVVPISVNFSRLHLQNPNFANELAEIARKYDVPFYLLELELTESIAMDNVELLERVMWELSEQGFSLSMDDFGSGFSSLGLLKSLPVDILKIDRSFFTTDAHDERSQVVVESVMQMAQRLQILTVAEGVELKEQADFLESISCTMSQGYYFARPMPNEDFEKLLEENADNPLAKEAVLISQHRKKERPASAFESVS